MTFTGSTGARWLDVTLIGNSFLLVLLLFGVSFLMHPGASLDPVLGEILLVITVIGAFIVAVGLLLGKRTRWKVPDPKVAKTR